MDKELLEVDIGLGSYKEISAHCFSLIFNFTSCENAPSLYSIMTTVSYHLTKLKYSANKLRFLAINLTLSMKQLTAPVTLGIFLHSSYYCIILVAKENLLKLWISLTLVFVTY